MSDPQTKTERILAVLSRLDSPAQPTGEKAMYNFTRATCARMTRSELEACSETRPDMELANLADIAMIENDFPYLRAVQLVMKKDPALADRYAAMVDARLPNSPQHPGTFR